MTQAGGNARASGGKRAYGMADDATRFLRELRKLRSEAGLELAELAARAHYPHDVIVAAEVGPGLPELPVLSAYVRGCGGGLAEWEERWRSVTGSPAAPLHLPARPAGCSSLAEAGAQAAYSSPAVDPEDQRRILAAITRAATETAGPVIPVQQPFAGTPARASRGGAREWDTATEGQRLVRPAPGTSAASAPGAAAMPAVASADSEPEPAAATGAGPGPVAAPLPTTSAARRTKPARRASIPYGAGIAAIVTAVLCIAGTILLLLR
jgi:hypothetical protein